MASMQIRPDEITKILKERIEGIEAASADLAEVGTVLSIGDGIARIHGLENAMSMEMLELPHDVTGLALNLESDNVGAVLFGEWDKIEEGDNVKRTDRLLEIPGNALADPDPGRVSARHTTRRRASTARAATSGRPPRHARPPPRRPRCRAPARSGGR